MRHLALWLLALSACSESNADTFAKPPPPPPATTVTVELAAVSLADDCAPPPPSSLPPQPAAQPASPPVTATPAKPAYPSEAPAQAPARRAPGMTSSRYGCDQTTMQLKITTPANFKAGSAKVKVKKVELLDADGKFLQNLTARNPRAWKNTTSYQPWDESIGPNQGVNSMYDLTSPDWGKLTNGRWNAHTKSFQVRVVVEVGGTNKTVTKTAVTAVRLPPPVPT